jgi:hypothetical protein
VDHLLARLTAPQLGAHCLAKVVDVHATIAAFCKEVFVLQPRRRQDGISEQ